ncbi:MAG: MoxR family ATPase [bacterium]|nr:ATP-binding protein [Deltaproteobacteria bacterium]MCP4906699.1 MoxR family ATPase [bacterium]
MSNAAAESSRTEGAASTSGNSSRFERFEGTSGYIASRGLVDAVNCALALQRPLLVKGEPGTGKTLLAHHVAEGLGMPLDSWHIKSTSKAEDGLYVYDTVQRLNDARFGDGDVKDIRSYIRLGPLGRVFSAENREVLLIDEIDKADLEFPNDILRELDEMQFTVLETGDEVVAKKRPMVIITSNNEKELPDAFLRRCVFHFIDFPDVEQMREIVDVHHPQLEKNLLEQVLVKFYWLREQKELRKRPSTSELIDWITALLRAGANPAQLESEIPFMGALLKNEQDTRAIQEFTSRGGTPPRNFDELKGPRR